uniref:Costars family protein ABRACL n=2 Tax=Anser TaxID=8842 RepID=A0A8B9I6A1_9AVES
MFCSQIVLCVTVVLPSTRLHMTEVMEGIDAHGGSFHSKETTMNVEHEITLLVEEIRRLGTRNADGQVSVKFGVLFADEKCANLFEALVGTLKAAKRRKIVTYQGELLLQGVHDNVDIILLQD